MAARKKLVDPIVSATASVKTASASQEEKIDLTSPELARKKRVDPADS